MILLGNVALLAGRAVEYNPLTGEIAGEAEVNRLLHRDDRAVEVGPIVEVLNEHQEAGLIAAFGGSNWSHERIQAANAYAEAHGLTPFVASSPQLSLAEMVQPPWEGCVSIGGPEGAAARTWYRETGLALFTWSSLAGGFFSGRFARDNLDSFESTSDVLCVGSYCYEWNFYRLDRTLALAERRGLTVPQVALAYDVRGAWLIQPSINLLWEPFRFMIQYSNIEGNFTSFGAFRDRDQVSFVVSYLLN